MEKRREIPGQETTPMGAPRAEALAVRARIERLGLDYFEAMQKIGYSKPTAYRLLNGTGSVKALRELDEWTRKQEMAKKVQTPQQASALLDEWVALGRELSAADAEQFASTLDGLRGLLEATKLRAASIRKMLRATPDNDK